jgi:serine protease Do
MKFLFFFPILFAGLISAPAADAQDNPSREKKTEEIIIRREGDNSKTYNITIDGERIIINGKPIESFTDKDITISKKKMIISDNGSRMEFNFRDGFGGGPFLGQGGDADESESRKAFLGVTTRQPEARGNGAEVQEVSPQSAAEKAGLQKGDLIVQVEDKEIENPDALSRIIGLYDPGTKVTVRYKRNGKTQKAAVTLGERKSENRRAPQTFSFSMPRMDRGAFGMPFGGFPGMDGDEGFPGNEENARGHRRKKLGLKIQDMEGGRVKVIGVEENSAAATAGLEKDDVITEIDGQPIGNTDDAREQLAAKDSKNEYRVNYLRNGEKREAVLRIPLNLKTINL